MKLLINQYKDTVKECDSALNSNQLDKKQISWYKKLKKDAIKKLAFYS